MVTIDASGEKVQYEGSECLKHFKCHGFDDTKALNYMSIYKIGAIKRVNIKTQYTEFTHTELRKTTTYTPKYWIWLNVDKDDPRELCHNNSCPPDHSLQIGSIVLTTISRIR